MKQFEYKVRVIIKKIDTQHAMIKAKASNEMLRFIHQMSNFKSF